MSKLSDMATGMKKSLAKAPHGYGWVRSMLPGGLEIILDRKHERYRLILRREWVYPSDTEVQVCAEVFGLADSEPIRRVVRSTADVTGRKIDWHHVEFTWRQEDATNGNSCYAYLPRAAATFHPVEGSDAQVWA